MFKFLHRRTAKKIGLKVEHIAGHTFSYWESPIGIPYKRVLAYFQAQKEAALGVGEKDLRAYIKVFREAFNNGNRAQQGALIEALEAQLNLFASWRNIFRLANALILIDGEPIKEMSAKHSQLKYALCEKNEEVRAFFLSRAWATLTTLKASATPIPPLDYLRQPEVKQTEDLFLRLIKLGTSSQI